VDHSPAPAPDKKTKTNHSQRRRDGVRHFFDRLDYITFRLFLLAMTLIGIFAVIKASLK
jgi:membrane protein required for beta-lactamase induction